MQPTQLDDLTVEVVHLGTGATGVALPRGLLPRLIAGGRIHLEQGHIFGALGVLCHRDSRRGQCFLGFVDQGMPQLLRVLFAEIQQFQAVLHAVQQLQGLPPDDVLIQLHQPVDLAQMLGDLLGCLIQAPWCAAHHEAGNFGRGARDDLTGSGVAGRNQD
ncbi:hypothetical protein M3B43_09545 [Nesterenkonia massiliensis]|uniref:PilZ domain-containing protein n=1 Tax=Nesterenkonia massiliensis TaxID=1232429 RepID=A0ABT2HS73_9MICC|nr:hypothetical protein [Nesterenkonia massiliensis]MCT1607559.1 hypothetical protein [Nesterenkonia massiliensis]